MKTAQTTTSNTAKFALAAILSLAAVLAPSRADAFFSSGYLGSRVVAGATINQDCIDEGATSCVAEVTPWGAFFRVGLVKGLRVFAKGIASDFGDKFSVSSLVDLVRQPVLRAMPIKYGRMSSSYGFRRHPILRKRIKHHGIDFAAARGTPVLAATGGVVIKASRMGGYGKVVIIDHGDGLTTRYAHLHRFKVRKGAKVNAGQQIGQVGTTGRSTGPHLHFEVRQDGKSVNPVGLMDRKQVLARL